jgi:hypothetical protein
VLLYNGGHPHGEPLEVIMPTIPIYEAIASAVRAEGTDTLFVFAGESPMHAAWYN